VPKTHHMKALDMSLCVNKNQSGCGGKWKNPCPYQKSDPKHSTHLLTDLSWLIHKIKDFKINWYASLKVVYPSEKM
jgi:hypothetical protein